MAIHLEITDRQGPRDQVLDEETFWIGSTGSDCPVCLDLGDFRGRILEVQENPPGRLRIRVEGGLTFPVRCATGNVGTRLQTLIDGDVLNIGPAMLRIRHVAGGSDVAAQELDPAALASPPGAPVGAWYETFMEVADHLEGVKSPVRGVAAALEGILAATGAERVCLQLDPEYEVDGQEAFYLGRNGRKTAFRVSRSLIQQVRRSGRAVHVPLAQADPVASRFHSVRTEGISAGIALPITGLGNTIGILYADCITDGATLTVEDLQRVAFISRLLASALGNRALVSSLLHPEGRPDDDAPHWALETRAPSCAEMVDRVKLYASADYTVLLRGDTGTGKEVIAHALHDLSRRAKGPFVPVNCAAIPEQLMESMLFGHEKGAFTGATQTRRGHFEESHGGTIFLDEIGDMALDLQAKILRVLQDRTVTPLGSRKQIKIDVRILAATHQDLENMVKMGSFREDLYYRLRELEILLPPLRERLEDLHLLIERFLAEAAQDLGYRRIPTLPAEVYDILRRHPWRGNIRELQHVVKGATLRAGGRDLEPEHLDLRRDTAPEPLIEGEIPEGSTWKERLEVQEKRALQRTLEEAEGNLTRAAEMFGVPRTTYREKLQRHGLLSG